MLVGPLELRLCNRAVWALSIFGILVSEARLAAAQSGSNSAAAQALFEQARTLMTQGRAPEACPKLEESQRLDPGSGTLLNLARCYEQSGRLASAWNKYHEAASAARSSRHAERENEARNKATALRPRLSTLVITVDPEVRDTPGLTITRDGEQVGAAQWGTPIPADAGEHTVAASASGRAPWQMIALVKGEASTTTVAVPALAQQALTAAPSVTPAPSATPNAVTPVEASPAFGTQRVLALVAGGVGLVGLGVGTVFGLKSKAEHDEAAKYCDGTLCQDPRGVSAGNDAYAHGTVSTIGMVVGAVGLAGGVTLWLTAPSAGSSPAAQVGLGFGKVQVRGCF